MKKILLTFGYSLLLAANASAVDFSNMLVKACAKLDSITGKSEKLKSEEFEELKSDEIGVNEDERGIILTFSAKFLFELGKADLNEVAEKNLLEVSKILAEYPNAKVEIEGHADITGSTELNQELSEQRAKNVMLFFTEQGLPKERFSAVGRGSSKPVASNETEEGREANRRVEVVIEAEEYKKEQQQQKLGRIDCVRFGVRLGINVNDFSLGDDRNDYLETGFGMGLGLVALIPITDNLTLSPEISLYYRELATEEYRGTRGTPSEVALVIPVLLHYFPIENVPFYLAAGPQLEIPISPEWETEIQGETKIRSYGDRAALDICVVLGVGYYINKNISVDARAAIGLTKPDVYESKSWLNQYGIGVTYFFSPKTGGST